MTSMHKIATQHCIIVYEEQDADTALMLQSVCSKTEGLLRSQWNLPLPSGTQVHIMRSWLYFPFNASIWPMKFVLAISLPYWAFRAKRMWAYTGGWALPYPRRPAIGVKPPSLLQVSDRSMGRRIFVDDMDDITKIQSITCHELTHASTARLKLPAWLNEGLAMVTVDAYFGHSTVKSETLRSLKTTQPKTNPRGYRQMHRADKDALVYLYVRGYWITRYFEEQHPEVLRAALSQRRHHTSLIKMLAGSLNLTGSDFWNRIDDFVVDHFVETLT